MTFEEWYEKNKSPNEYIGNVYLKDRYKQAWNAAIASVLSDLQAKVHINKYNVTTIDYDEATRVCTRLLSKSS